MSRGIVRLLLIVILSMGVAVPEVEAAGPQATPSSGSNGAAASSSSTSAPPLASPPAVSADAVSSAVAGTSTTTVSATTGWQSANMTLQAGQSFSISYVSGTWTVDYIQFPYVGPNGYSPDIDAQIYQGCKPLPDQPYAKLLGQIGGGSTFPIGASYTGTADVSGTLYLRIHDDDGCLGDNDGAVTMQVTTDSQRSTACSSGEVLAESSLSAFGSVQGHGCNVTLLFSNGQDYWTNFKSTSTGQVTYNARAGDDLFANLNLLAPEMTLHYKAHFSEQQDSITFTTTPELSATSLNIVMLLLGLVPGNYANALVNVGAAAVPQILQALPQMPDIQDLAVAIVEQNAGIPSENAILASLDEFAKNQAEQVVFASLLHDIGVIALREAATTVVEHIIDLIASASVVGKATILLYKASQFHDFYASDVRRAGTVTFAPVNNLMNYRSPQTFRQIGECFTQNRRSLQQNALQSCGLLNYNGLTRP